MAYSCMPYVVAGVCERPLVVDSQCLDNDGLLSLQNKISANLVLACNENLSKTSLLFV